jgi:hypothetical protein
MHNKTVSGVTLALPVGIMEDTAFCSSSVVITIFSESYPYQKQEKWQQRTGRCCPFSPMKYKTDQLPFFFCKSALSRFM